MLEIERKFLVDPKKWTPKTSGVKLVQAYLSTDKDRVVRVRIKGDAAYLTIKGRLSGITRTEMEYPLPLADAQTLLAMCLEYPIEKTRYTEQSGGKIWEIDVFEGINRGLLLAEIELKDENESFELPAWALGEVSTDSRYFNAWLSEHPFTKW